jgi:hypothetical protein
MFRKIAISALIASALIACDVRKKDKIADGSNTSITTDTSKNQVAAEPTTVQIIDSVFDFGKVAEGETVEFSYRFKNTGSNPLVISNATASCGCTVPEKPEAPIKPGETGYIKVKFNSDGRVGAAHKTVSVVSNANPSFPELLLKGEVLAKNKQ